MSDMTQERIDEINKEADESAIRWIRDYANGFGFNCAFADDDLRVICSLANRAIEAGLTDHLSPRLASQLKPVKE